MNIETLRLFVDVARRLSFAAVAKEHDVDPSSISRAISGIESHLGLRLFNRTTRTVTLTEAGEIYLTRIANIVEEYDQAEEQARSTRETATGTLKLTASVAFGECVIVPLISKFNALYPDVKLELLFTDTNLELVSNGIDLAIRLAPSLAGDVIISRLMQTKYRVVASPDYLRNHTRIERPEDIKAHRCTAFALPAYRNQWKFRKKEHGQVTDESISINPGITVSSALSIRSLVKQGAGPALLADWLIHDDIKTGELIELLPNHEVTATDFDTSAWIVYPSRSYLPLKVRVMIDFLKSKLPKSG